MNTVDDLEEDARERQPGLRGRQSLVVDNWGLMGPLQK